MAILAVAQIPASNRTASRRLKRIEAARQAWANHDQEQCVRNGRRKAEQAGDPALFAAVADTETPEIDDALRPWLCTTEKRVSKQSE